MDNILNMGYQLYYIRRMNTEMYQYQLTASESAAEENGKVTYGISITDKNGICGKIEDISPDKAEMEKLLKRIKKQYMRKYIYFHWNIYFH